MSRRTARLSAALLVALGAALVISVAAFGDDEPQPVNFVHNPFNAPAPVSSATFGSGPTVHTGTAICTSAPSTAANVNTDCETTSVGPHNETSIAVNPTDHSNIIGGANDYQLGLNPGGHVSETVLSRAHVSFDGGRSWSMYPIFSDNSYQGTGDPALAFDASGHAYYGTLGFRFVGPANATNPDVLVSNSGDGGKTWDTVRVAAGSGTETGVGDLLDKEYVAAWGNGNAIVTYGDFRLGQKGSFISAKIYDSVTHDFGATWTTPQVISGNLDQSFVSTPVVTSNGHIFVSFLNTTDLTTGRDDYEVVEVDPTTGANVFGPQKVATVIDGSTDYPTAFGRQTYHDSLFRSWAAGNIAADPTNPAHLAVVWSDMRNSPTPAPSNPYSAVTNSDVVVSQSTDSGRTWGPPVAIPLAGDQFQQWSAFDASGALRIGTFDRSGDPANHKYDYSLLTQTGPTSFSRTVVSTQQSDPTTGDRWFAATANASFPFATSFLGDYSGIAVVPGTTQVVSYWTDMRNDVSFAGRTGHGEDVYFAKTSTPG